MATTTTAVHNSALLAAAGVALSVAAVAVAQGDPFPVTSTIGDLAGGGLGFASIEAMAYGKLTLERAGVEGVRSGLVPGWGFALAVLAVVAAGWMIAGIDPPTALAAMAGAMLGPATALAMRCARVAAVLGQMTGNTAG